MRVLATAVLVLFLAGTAGCRGAKEGGGGGEEAADAVAIEEEGTTADAPAEEVEEVREKTYFSNHDPAAVYTLADLPRRGSYLKIDFTALTPEELDRVQHRLKTEYCTCGCVDDTIDECLVVDPACNTALELARMILREERSR